MHARFKPEVADDDPRVLGIVASLGPLPGRRVLDLGCGKGRFARVLAARGPGGRARRLRGDARGRERGELDRVLGSARRLPFGAVELRRRDRGRGLRAPRAPRDRRRLPRGDARAPAGRAVRARGQERAGAERPTALAAGRGGQVARPAEGALDVSGRRPGPRAMVPAASACGAGSCDGSARCGSRTSSRATRPAGSRSGVPRDAVVRALGGPGAGRGRMNGRYTPIPASLPLLLWKTPPGLELILAQEGVPFEVVREPHPLVFRGGRFVLFDGRTTPRAALSAMLSPEHVAIDVDTCAGRSPATRSRPWSIPGARGPRGPSGSASSPSGSRGMPRADPPPADRPAAAGRHRGRRGLGPPVAVPVSVSLGVQLPRRPG